MIEIRLLLKNVGKRHLVRRIWVAVVAFIVLVNPAICDLTSQLEQNTAINLAATGGNYLQYAEQIAQVVQQKMWDSLYEGYFEIMNRSWNEIIHPHKEFIYTYWQKAFCYLYDGTGNATYLDWARKITDVEIAYAWDSVNGGWYDEYNRTWGQGNLPRSRAYIKNAAVQGSMINMLLEVYSRTGNKTYYEYAVKTADFLISNFHDPVYGGFYRTYNQSRGQPQDTGKGTEDSYGQVSYGLLKLYELTYNSTYLDLSKEAMDFTINHLWDSTYGGWLTEVDRTGSVIINDRKYPNEEIWPVFGGFAYYYKITGNLTALNYVYKTMDYIDSKLWDPVYGGWFRSLWRNNTIRDDTKTAWDLAGEPWMIWEVYKMTGNTTYQEMARKGLDWVLNTVMYDTVFGGVVTEVDRTGTTITDSVKDVEVESDAIASFSCVTDRDFTPISLTGNLLQARYLAEKVQQYMWDERYGGYFWAMNRTWGVKISDKTSTMLIIMGLLNLYERSGNTTYLVWAENAVNFVLSNAWDKVNGGVYDVYNRSWSPKTTVKTLQRQAELLRVLIDLYRHTNHQKYYDYANRTADFILAHYHDAQYGGQYKTFDQSTGSPVTTNKDAEVSLGSFGWGMMYWYSLTENRTALEYTKEANDFIWTYLRDEIYGGLVTEVDRTGFLIVNDRKYPNEIIWGTLGMLEYYRETGNTTVKGWIQELFSYVRNVMWDPVYGGWFRSLWRNNTIRYSTKEGWSQTEQPWFWWFAYSILGDNYYADVAQLSLNWTRTYLYDPIYSGYFLELYQNGTLFDDEKVDSVQGAAISALALVEDSQTPITTYALNIDSSPISVSFTLNGTAHTTPWTDSLEEGTYSLVMPSNVVVEGVTYSFQKWEDGSTSPTRTIDLLADMTVVAYYEAVIVTHTLSVSSSPITGISFTVDEVAHATPWSDSLTEGSHTVAMPSSIVVAGTTYAFKNWEEGSTNPTRVIELVEDMSITAYYQKSVPPPSPPPSSPPPSPAKGALEVHAYYSSTEINATVEVIGVGNYTTPFTLELEIETYTLNATYAGQTQTEIATIAEEAATRVDFHFVDMTNPTAEAGPDQTVDEDTLVTFDGSGSSDDIAIASYTWIFMDVTWQTLRGVRPTYNFTTPGVYMVILNVTDAAGNYATDTVLITVLDVTDPGADAGSDQTVTEDAAVSFDGGGSSDNVGVISYEWDLGDGTIGTGVTITHTYTEPGTYTVTLIVRDAAGNSDKNAVIITVLRDNDGDETPDITDMDDDNDGMPDTWEIDHGLDPFNAADAFLDPDNDGLTNLEEYQKGKDPSSSDAAPSSEWKTGVASLPRWIAGAVVAVGIVAAIVVYLVKVKKLEWRREE